MHPISSLELRRIKEASGKGSHVGLLAAVVQTIVLLNCTWQHLQTLHGALLCIQYNHQIGRFL